MKQSVTWVNPKLLKRNKVVNGLYSIPENYETIKENIALVGILTPLHVVRNVVVSGNLRLQIALELGFDVVPVIYVPKQKISEKLLAVSYGQQRVKKYSEILKEYEILEASFPIGKGKRTDLNPEIKKNVEKRKQLDISKAKLVLLKGIKVMAKELYGEGTEAYKDVWVDVDAEKASLNRIFKGLKREKSIRVNEMVLPEHYEFNSENARIFNKSCSSMSELEDGSVACIITSPPYFQMRDYGTGIAQRGLEKDVNEFIKGLLEDFRDCNRVLKEDGSLWVNLSECVIEGNYNVIPHRFVLAMIEEGWIFNDEWIWVKNNPVFTQAKRAVRSHEYIFHFVKSKDYFYDVSWLNELTDPEDKISYGTSGKISNLMSSMDFRGNVIRTNSNNMEGLRSACRDKGFHLTHNAAFPVTIPLIAVLTSSKVGDTILDIYSGTGTTGEAALATRRKYVGYEIKPEFVMATEVRLNSLLQDERMSVAA